MSEESRAVELLLNAEEDANKIIKQAQMDRENKLKQAKIAAEQNIAVFRQDEELRFNETVKQRFGANVEDSNLEKKTEEEIKLIYRDYDMNKASVIDMLLERIVNVNLEIPMVLKGNFEENLKIK